MLINTTYKTDIRVTLCLEFDDGSTKNATLQVGDIVEVTYRKDYTKCKDTGKIRNIYIFANGLPTNRQTVVFEFDFSDDYDSKKRKIPVEDIIYFNVIKFADGTNGTDTKPVKPCPPPPKPPCIPDWPIPLPPKPPCPPPSDDDNNGEGNTEDNTEDDTLGHHYTHHMHSCVCRPCPPPKPLGLRSFYVGTRARVGKSKVM